jgi:transcriptional regulator with XRE-family HTH domain
VEAIKRIRKAKKLSLSQLAARTGLHPVALARVERSGQDAKASTVLAIARALGVPVCELFEEGPHEHHRRKQKR